jgi:hypothetical protein
VYRDVLEKAALPKVILLLTVKQKKSNHALSHSHILARFDKVDDFIP